MSRSRKLALALPLIACGAVVAPSLAQPQTEAPQVLPEPQPGVEANSDWRASQLIGLTMTNALDQSVGTVSDIIIDSDGKVVAVIVNVGGFLGLGETAVPIALRHLVITRVDADQLAIRTSLSREAIDQAARQEPVDSPLPDQERIP